MNFKHKEKVRVTGGFHKGQTAIIMDKRGWWFFKDYLVYFEWEGSVQMTDEGKHWESRFWIPEKHLELLNSLPKKGNVIQAQERFKEK